MKDNEKYKDLKVLVVDDHQLSQKLLRQQLETLGFVYVDAVANGAEALEEMDRQKYDIVLFDWAMPVMDGMAFLKKCQEKEGAAETAYIMVSSEIQKERIMEVIQAGAASYLMKPVAMEDLQAKINKVIDWLKKSKYA